MIEFAVLVLFWGTVAGASAREAASAKKLEDVLLNGGRARLSHTNVRRGHGGMTMYAVIRAGGKQYRVAPGDVVRLETQSGAQDGKVEFGDVLAVSAGEGQIARPGSGALVSGEVLGEGRGKKVLVFHYKRKKQYKKIAGHRQPFTSVRITEIAFDGQKFSAPESPKKEVKPKKEAAEPKAEAKAAKPAAKKKAPAPKKSAAKKSSTRKKK